VHDQGEDFDNEYWPSNSWYSVFESTKIAIEILLCFNRRRKGSKNVWSMVLGLHMNSCIEHALVLWTHRIPTSRQLLTNRQ
jgi:hypothetical protein